jgi:hypothetical protein
MRVLFARVTRAVSPIADVPHQRQQAYGQRTKVENSDVGY